MVYDGIMVNEHHNTPSCMNTSCNLAAAVLEKLTCLHETLGMDHLIMYGQESKMSNIGLFGKEVLPVINDW